MRIVLFIFILVCLATPVAAQIRVGPVTIGDPYRGYDRYHEFDDRRDQHWGDPRDHQQYTGRGHRKIHK
jgi:hypothetical protein